MAAKPTYSEFCSADIIQANLFEPLDGVTERKRKEVHALKLTNYSVFTTALACLLNDWLGGKIGSGAPTEAWERDIVRKVNGLNGNNVGPKEELDKETRTVYDNLVSIKVLGHLRIVTSHRMWIRGVWKFCKAIGVEFSEKIDNLVWRHDLSKYSHKEVLGYAIMFGDGSIGFRDLETEEEKSEWQSSLYNHYAHNPHHPEYFYPLEKDGKTRKRDKSIREIDPVCGQDYLDESLIDMLAAQGERLLSDDKVISVSKWFDIPDRFFGRYNSKDADYVKEKLNEWKQLAKYFFSVDGNQAEVKGIFDSRDIVYDSQE